MLLLNENHGELYKKALQEHKDNSNKDLYSIAHQLFCDYYLAKGLDEREAEFMSSVHANSVDFDRLEEEPRLQDDLQAMAKFTERYD